ncbi:Cysteine synthase B [Colletotrichum sp. SAR 10_96]|nr:Cysteine synthase B [Colletotrichum sp. SAR 10_96]
MAEVNHLNVYKGPDAVKDYFNPDIAPPLPLVEIPDCLNPYRNDGVRIYAKMMSMHPANNVKAMPALNLLQNGVVPGKTETVVEYSSGSTVISMSLISRVYYGNSYVRAYLSNKTSQAKLRLMQFFGLDITLFGGPSQPEPADPRGGIRAAKDIGEKSETAMNPNQYENDDNWKSHIRWTGPQILRQLPEINLICAGMGTSGTMTGLGTYFKDNKPSVYRLGVCTAAGDRVPGPRSYALLQPVEFPWRAAVDHIEHVGSHDSYSYSLNLTREGIVCGPSSGFNLKGLFQFLDQRKAAGTLSELAGENGEIHCVFVCCDLPYQYIDEYFAKLGPEHFPTIHNENLQKVDLHRYDEAWEKEPAEAFMHIPQSVIPNELSEKLPSTPRYVDTSSASLIPRSPNTVIVDLRRQEDYQTHHIPGSENVPVVESKDWEPFSDAKVLETLWLKLEATFEATSEIGKKMEQHRSKPILLLCYNGNNARVAASVLRAKGFEADCLQTPTPKRHSLFATMKYQVYLAAAAAAFGAADAQCNANNCARAVTGTRLGPQTQASRRADCSSFQRTTITRFETTTFVTVTSSATFDVTRTFAPSTVTVTTTVPPIIIDPSFSIGLPEPPVVTSFSGPDRRDLEGRQLVSSAIFPPVPFYASACSDEPSATETDEPSATGTDEPSATETDGPSATETDEPIPSTTEVFPTSVLPDPTTFATSLLPVTSDEPTPTSSDVEPSSTAGPDICSTFGSRFPYTLSTLLTFCSCSYSNPRCAEGTSQNQRTLPLILTIETCANSCDLFANCVAFSYNAVTLECRLLDADGFGTTTGSSDWVLVDRTSGSCGRDTCEPGAASPSPSATPSTLP